MCPSTDTRRLTNWAGSSGGAVAEAQVMGLVESVFDDLSRFLVAAVSRYGNSDGVLLAHIPHISGPFEDHLVGRDAYGFEFTHAFLFQVPVHLLEVFHDHVGEKLEMGLDVVTPYIGKQHSEGGKSGPGNRG